MEGRTYIIITGNPLDGFSYIGPYSNADEASTAADLAGLVDSWWLAILDNPWELDN